MSKFVAKQQKYLIGIDEVGRGPIAGPVAVGAFIFLKPAARKLFRGVKESKQLSEQKREEWFGRIGKARRDGHVDFCVDFQSERVIDDKGLSCAIKTALTNSLRKVISRKTAINKKHDKISSNQVLILLDGGLKAPVDYANQKTIVKGDEKEMIIALASICAKVLRDRKMNLLAKKHPKYGFEKHKGYGTRAHYATIKKHGILKVHRRSFMGNLL
ncbi:MAG: hypothetical protein A3C79_02220 [Candidatus Taylorbacteria bacterium RIFCSPHIGHO2_02_FULL_45_28]|uniref:Ribonuclease n=1 Tax=Candidatus Taylorbacteria bacterium RIFCSPHIGHO2_12_FULL_45_16 TaxID=1802315 RepID=A0A1G2MXT1_9BACT|nr:MAG: hypothetical protein A2830_03030 [Candidatus Taylorbacteria bacterium RIFCSPHIGHO2_01_FULL_44_110]OHA25272.1 MAG: hypothetical protein A3C79_02220 [Candidatus Taylorbacteria bacterium RIFCSPHIGHO2_02_FULL_45_28]OHA28644.1 MAG: hypothetical protein A3F51_03985 [Candidatus Taylorbacteria bacterium RIFCSPHIGHO2_12_FULL_45_16]OHA32931.1 MAG: hypothetical protein A3A23_00860 [Candidatus Taylorbacteria bacterium RIFCSPLOWO2_01_FULL_45_59]OHA38687.1 MAG: hypothetical protein A3I98_01900 [Candi